MLLLEPARRADPLRDPDRPIIPNSTPAARLEELVTLYNLPAGFDLQDPQNLAPICGPCNTEKSNGDFLDAPITLSKLRLAAHRASRVIAQVEDYYRASAVAHHLVAAAASDLSRPQSRGEFLQFAQAIVQIMAQLDEGSIDFQAVRELRVDVGDGDFLLTRVNLDGRGRTAQAIIEAICGCSLADALGEGLAQLLSQAVIDAQAELSDRRRATDSVGSVVLTLAIANVTLTELQRDGGTVTVRFTGTLEADGALPYLQENRFSADYELLEKFDTVEIERDFELMASWTLSAGPGLPDQVITTFGQDHVAARAEEAWVDALEKHEQAAADDANAERGVEPWPGDPW
ncbi:hypothetical protein ACLQ3H_16595 [Micromonospora saelicesensis]|uniref:hypothetical protein n=1 Tax=Micromonospora saelicesensis TaxID=285676 RepID=UPI003CEBFA47